MMKIFNESLNIKSLALLLIVFLPLVVSCNKEKDIIEPGSNSFSVLQVSFDSLDVVTKTQYTFANKKLKTTWKEGDEIAFICEGDIYRFVQNGSITDGGHSATFVCDRVLPRFYGQAIALYPYRADLSFSLEDQTGTIENLSKTDILIARASFSENITLKFSPLCAILRFPKGLSVAGEYDDGEIHFSLEGENVANSVYYNEYTRDISFIGDHEIVIGASVKEGKLLEDVYVAFYPIHKEGEYLYAFGYGIYGAELYKNGISTSKIYSIDPSSIGYVDFGGRTSLESFCLQHYDRDRSGKISYAEAMLVSSITLFDQSSSKGIEHFKNLTELTMNTSDRTINLKNNPKLTSLNVSGNITQLDLSNNPELTSLTVSGNITQLDLSNNPELTSLTVSGNITQLDLSNNLELIELNCSNNKLSQLDVSKNTKLDYLSCSNNNLTQLDLSNNPELTSLTVSGNNLTQLDLSNNLELRDLSCSNNKLSQLDVSKNTKLDYLSCSNNNLTQLDLSNNLKLRYLRYRNNSLSQLDISKNTGLTDLDCVNNNLTQLDLSNNLKLRELNCSNNKLSQLDVSNNTKLDYLSCSNNNLTQLDLKKNTSLYILTCNYNQLTSLDVSNCSSKLSLMAWPQRGTLYQLFVRKEQKIEFFYSTEDQSETYGVYPPDRGTEIVVVD